MAACVPTPSPDIVSGIIRRGVMIGIGKSSKIGRNLIIGRSMLSNTDTMKVLALATVKRLFLAQFRRVAYRSVPQQYGYWVNDATQGLS